jgi:hypothetical protein
MAFFLSTGSHAVSHCGSSILSPLTLLRLPSPLLRDGCELLGEDTLFEVEDEVVGPPLTGTFDLKADDAIFYLWVGGVKKCAFGG